MARWLVTVSFTDDAGVEHEEDVEVEANLETLAEEKAEDMVDALHDVDTIDDIDARVI